MLDLKKFIEEKKEIVPVVNGWGQVGFRKIWHSGGDGWYLVTLGSQVTIERKATALEIFKVLQPMKKLKVYALGSEGIPTNFDNFSVRGFGEAVIINFINLPAFEVAKVALWEDGRFYYYEQDSRFQRNLLNEVKKSFEGDGSIKGIKGVTPELFYYYLLLTLQHQAFKEVEVFNKLKLSEEEKKKRIEQFKNSFDERLKKVIEDAGGKLVRFVKSNANSFLVTWRIGNQTVKSTINDRFQILNAGYCLSGADRDHSMASIVQLAKMFRQTSPLYITRE